MAKRRWTARRRAALEGYVGDLATRMRLADWTISLAWDNAAGDAGKELIAGAVATITPLPSSRHAVLRVSAALLELSADEQTQVLCHELVHCHLFALAESTRATFELLDGGERRVAELALNQHLELATDALADAFAPHAPRFVVDRATTGD